MPVSPRIAQDRQARYDARVAQAKAIIPEGCYCYTIKEIETGEKGLPIIKTTPCPYWKARQDWREQAYGYCRFLKAGDSSKGLDRDGRPRATMLLWDQVKECGLNPGDDANA